MSSEKRNKSAHSDFIQKNCGYVCAHLRCWRSEVFRKCCNFLVKRIFWKKRIKVGAKISNKRTCRCKKTKQLKMFFRTNRRSLKCVSKEFSKVNACARDPPWCYKNTQFSRQDRWVTHTNPEWYVLTVFSAAPCSFDLQTTVSCYNFKLDKKSLSTLLPEVAFTVVTWYTNRCIQFYTSAPNKEINFFIFCCTIVNMSGSLEKQGRAHKQCTPVDPHIWMCKSRTISTNLHTATMWGHRM